MEKAGECEPCRSRSSFPEISDGYGWPLFLAREFDALLMGPIPGDSGCHPRCPDLVVEVLSDRTRADIESGSTSLRRSADLSELEVVTPGRERLDRSEPERRCLTLRSALIGTDQRSRPGHDQNVVEDLVMSIHPAPPLSRPAAVRSAQSARVSQGRRLRVRACSDWRTCWLATQAPRTPAGPLARPAGTFAGQGQALHFLCS